MKNQINSLRVNKKMKTLKHVFPISAVALAVMCSSSAMASSFDLKKTFTFSKAPEAPTVAPEIQTSVALYDLGIKSLSDASTEFKFAFNSFSQTPKISKDELDGKLILNFGKIDLALKGTPDQTITAQFKKYGFTKNESSEVILTIDLADYSKFTTRRDGGDFYLVIHSSTPAVVGTSQEVLKSGVTGISYARTKGGEDQAIINLSDVKTPYVVTQSEGKVLIKLKGTKLPANLVKTQNFNDIRAVVVNAKSYNEKDGAVIELTPRGSFDYMVLQVDKKVTINVAKKAAVRTDGKGAGAGEYSGKKISMEFQDVDLRRALQLLAKYNNINIVTSDSVAGSISLRLQDVPWDQALNIILKTKGLAQRRDGSVIWVAPSDEVSKVENQEIEAKAQSVKLAPMETAFIQLNYASAAEIAEIIKMDVSSSNTNKALEQNAQYRMARLNVNGSENALLSARGSVSFDARTNTLIVNDTLQKIDEVKRVISQLDIPVKQVMVEARIVRATSSFTKSMGVKWAVGKNGTQPIGSSLGQIYSASKYGSASGTGSVLETGLNLDLGQIPGTSQIAFGLINTSNALLGLELSALQTNGLGEVLSSPKVMTGDKQLASIKSGVKLPYTTRDDDGNSTTTFQDAVLELSVTPSITPDGAVQMKLDIRKDTQGQLTDEGYAIDTSSLSTNVLVSDGETVVLGGLYEDTKVGTSNKVPVLSSLPLVGNLFKSKSDSDFKQELLIFITPKIESNSSKK